MKITIDGYGELVHHTNFPRWVMSNLNEAFIEGVFYNEGIGLKKIVVSLTRQEVIELASMLKISHPNWINEINRGITPVMQESDCKNCKYGA